ncbi:hypothetical protein BpHYR1_016776 [Brachionus plicatilis]|uniref:Uncharacterized protein n=1 Tax=Brachionus plicatilis TaxID=10195 RepID=A0A3M7PPH3_BRAPC|nr:hypothetical protein BpHYR1_016776 [Brachionus plicatilis]
MHLVLQRYFYDFFSLIVMESSILCLYDFHTNHSIILQTSTVGETKNKSLTIRTKFGLYKTICLDIRQFLISLCIKLGGSYLNKTPAWLKFQIQIWLSTANV